MAFTVQNILKYPLNFLGNIILPDGKLDLLTLYSADQIKSMLLYGELYNYIMGRSLTIVNPNADVYQLGLTPEQHSTLSNAGFLKGYLGLETLKDAFKFTSDGYLITNTSVSVGNVTVDTGALATSAKQDLLYSKTSDAYSVEVAINNKLSSLNFTSDGYLNVNIKGDIGGSVSIDTGSLATSAKQDLLYTKTSDAYSIEVAINNKLSLLNFNSDGYLNVNVIGNIDGVLTIDQSGLDLLSTSAKQDDAYAVENVINSKLDLLATSAKQDLLYTKTSDAYSIEVAINNQLSLFNFTSDGYLNVNVKGSIGGNVTVDTGSLATSANQLDAYAVENVINTKLDLLATSEKQDSLYSKTSDAYSVEVAINNQLSLLSFTADGYLNVNVKGNLGGSVSIDTGSLSTSANQLDAYAVENLINTKLDLLATSANQDLFLSIATDAYSIENVMNTKLDLLATSANQTLLYSKQSDAYSIEVAINNQLSLLNFTADGYLNVNVKGNLGGSVSIDTGSLATSANQSDAYAVENVINAKLDLLATSANQTLLYSKQSDAYSVENVINTKLDLLATKSNQVDAYNRAGESLTTLNSILVQDTAINGKLPASLGQKTSAASLPVVLASDAYVQIAAFENAYQTIRTFSNSLVDSEPPTSFTTLSNYGFNGYAEILYIITSFGGTVAPSTITFRTWDKVAGSTIVKVDDFTMDTVYIALTANQNPLIRRIIPFNSKETTVTVSFAYGYNPTVTGTVYARAVSVGGLQRKDLVYDNASGYPVVQNRGYDSINDSIRVTNVYTESDLYLEEASVVDTTALAAGTEVYIPNSDGILVQNYDTIGWEYSLTANSGADSYVQCWFEATMLSRTWTQRNIITLSGIDLTTGVKIAATPIVTANRGTVASIVNFYHPNATRMRMVVKPITAVSGAVRVSIRRKIRGT